MNKIYHGDCMQVMANMPDNCVDLILTDIPYNEVNRNDNGLRHLNKQKADILIFDLDKFMSECYRLVKSTIIIFCGIGQISKIGTYFDNKRKQNKGSMRQLIWSKTNPSPMNGKHIYLSATENAIWFKKRGGTFNAYCKKNVFTFPTGRSKLHPTEKNHKLLADLILDNSNEGDVVFDPCCGSGAHLLVAKQLNRKYIGCELDKTYFDIANKRLEE